jgi:hypothetical protein
MKGIKYSPLASLLKYFSVISTFLNYFVRAKFS